MFSKINDYLKLCNRIKKDRYVTTNMYDKKHDIWRKKTLTQMRYLWEFLFFRHYMYYFNRLINILTFNISVILYFVCGF
jgi:hypothetical protein